MFAFPWVFYGKVSWTMFFRCFLGQSFCVFVGMVFLFFSCFPGFPFVFKGQLLLNHYCKTTGWLETVLGVTFKEVFLGWLFVRFHSKRRPLGHVRSFNRFNLGFELEGLQRSLVSVFITCLWVGEESCSACFLGLVSVIVPRFPLDFFCWQNGCIAKLPLHNWGQISFHSRPLFLMR